MRDISPMDGLGLSRRACLALIAIALFAQAAPLWAQGSVRLEIAVEKGAPLTASREWYDVFTSLGVTGLRIRSANDGDKASVDEGGRKDARSYEVHAVLKSNNVLLLPGGSFNSRDRAGLKKWLENLSTGGKSALGAVGQRTPFGLDSKQLIAVNIDLDKRIAFDTSGLTLGDLLDKVRGQRAFPLAIATDAAGPLASTKLRENLKGVSTGVALAIALRPAGLALAPERSAGSVQYRIGKPTGGEVWPPGWPPRRASAKVFPKLYEMIDVEISETPLPEALDAIVEQLEIPLFFDHNALALHGVDPDKVLIKLPAKKLSYSQILQKILFQARLRSELRIDDADKPFLWITTVKPAP